MGVRFLLQSKVNIVIRRWRERFPILGNKARRWSKRLRGTFQSVCSARMNARKILLNKVPNEADAGRACRKIDSLDFGIRQFLLIFSGQQKMNNWPKIT